MLILGISPILPALKQLCPINTYTRSPLSQEILRLIMITVDHGCMVIKASNLLLVSFLNVCNDLSSVEELCAVDLYHGGTLSHYDQMEMLLSSCKQIHKANFLGPILHSQVFGILCMIM